MTEFTLEYDTQLKEYECLIFGLSIWFDELKLDDDLLYFCMKGCIICVFLPEKDLLDSILTAYQLALIEVA